jgi:uncharacterized membrane protein (UPF0127 family)
VTIGKANRRSFVNATKSTTLACDGRLATGFFARLRGLLFTNELKKGDGLFLSPCNSIHMLGMLYAIDAVFVDKNNKVVALVKGIKPWRISAMYLNAESCLELPPGTIDDTGTAVGDQIVY